MPLTRLAIFPRILFIAWLLVLGWLLALGHGCAYYNTFYNTKRHFQAGERANRNVRAGQSRDVQNYRKCIETGARLLELYPKSRWVDNCLLLMGKAYYRSDEFARAERKFEELISNFPRSKLIPEARLWLAEAFVQMKRSPEAVLVLEQLLAAPKAKAFWARGAFLLGDIHFTAERYGDAADAYREAAQRYRDKVHRAESLFMLGRSLFLRKEFEEAKATFERIPKLKPPRDLVYMALVESGRCTARLGDVEGALALLRRLRKDIRFQDYSSGIDLTLANIAAGQADYDEATQLYQAFVRSNPGRGETAEAFFHMGLICRDHRRDLPTAIAYFDSAQSTGSGGLVDSARAEVQKLNRGLAYIREVTDFEAQLHYIDSVLKQGPATEESLLSAPPDSAAPDSERVEPQHEVQEDSSRTEGVVTEDTLGSPPPAEETRLTIEDLHAAKANLQVALFHVGEFYWYDLKDPDSAFYFFERAAQDTFDRETRWRAYLVLAELAKQRGADEQVIRQYYQAALATKGIPLEAENRAREALGLPLKSAPQDTLREKYLNVEEGILDTTASPDSLLATLDSLMMGHPLSPYYPKLLFAKAHIYEHRLRNLDSTKAVYRRLISLYPDSAFSLILTERLDTTRLAARAEEGLSPGSPAGEGEGLEPGEEDGWPPPEESLLGRRGR